MGLFMITDQICAGNEVLDLQRFVHCYTLPQMRITIDAKDVARVTGRSVSQSQKLLTRIRKAEGKQPRDLVSIEEFCRHTRLPKGEVERGLSR